MTDGYNKWPAVGVSVKNVWLDYYYYLCSTVSSERKDAEDEEVKKMVGAVEANYKVGPRKTVQEALHSVAAVPGSPMNFQHTANNVTNIENGILEEDAP